MAQLRSNLSYRVIPLAFVAVAACGRNDRTAMNDQLRADLAAAAMSPSQRMQYASPTELGYGQPYNGQVYGNGAYGAYPPPPPGYVYAPAPNYPQPVYGYPQAQPVYAPAPRRTTTVVRRAPSSGSVASSNAGGSGAGSGSGSGSGTAQAEPVRNTTRGAVIGAATGTAVGILTSKDKVKGGAVGAVAGAVLGGVIGSQVYTSGRKPRGW